jgi:hypothetical protein
MGQRLAWTANPLCGMMYFRISDSQKRHDVGASHRRQSVFMAFFLQRPRLPYQKG